MDRPNPNPNPTSMLLILLFFKITKQTKKLYFGKCKSPFTLKVK